MEKLAQLLRAELDARKMSVRQLAIELGMSHATVTRVLAALPVDVQTMMTVCDWLGVALIDVLDQRPADAALAQRLAVLINREPDLGAVFTSVLVDIEKGEMDPEDLRDIVEYATFKLENRALRNRKGTGEAKGRAAGGAAKP